jgi:hypothetical protein
MLKSRQELINFIRNKHEKEGLSLPEIAGLVKPLYKSPKTGKPLTVNALKQVAFSAGMKKRGATETTSNVMALIEEILDIKELPAEKKIDLINRLRAKS